MTLTRNPLTVNVRFGRWSFHVMPRWRWGAAWIVRHLPRRQTWTLNWHRGRAF